MRDDIAEVDEHPSRRRQPFDADRTATLLLAGLDDRLRDRLDLPVGRPAADDEVVSDGRELADVQEDDVVRLLVRGGVDEPVREVRRVEDGYLRSTCPYSRLSTM